MNPTQLIEDIKASKCPDFGRKDWQGSERFFEYLLANKPLRKDSLIIEFGVFSGTTFDIIYRNTGGRLMYGFDSFVGLPENWYGESGILIQPKGFFSYEIYNWPTPKDTDTKKYVAGWVEDTYPKFLQEHKQDIQFMHIDLDLYNPCKFVLDNSIGRLKSGAVVVIDDIFGYDGWNIHAAKAFCEWAIKFNVKYKPIASCGLFDEMGYSSVAFKILQDV